MAEKDLIHLKMKGDVYSDNVRSKQKGSGSPKRKQAQQERRKIERLKNMSPEQLEERGLEMLRSPEKFSLEILFIIQELLKKKDLPDKTKLDLIGKMCDVKNTIWGSKSFNANLNIEAPKNIYDRMIERAVEYQNFLKNEEEKVVEIVEVK